MSSVLKLILDEKADKREVPSAMKERKRIERTKPHELQRSTLRYVLF